MTNKPKPVPACPICYLPCDPAIHAATERIHEWLRERVNREPERDTVPQKPKKQANPDHPFQVPPTRVWKPGSMSDGERHV